ncbi:MAG: transporter substrate-binding domain-containing protein [Myxococcota bacterium]
MRASFPRRWPPLAALSLFLAAAVGSVAEPGDPLPAGAVRVGTSGDYQPFSVAAEGEAPLRGFDIALIEAWAEDTGRPVIWVPFRWPKLMAAFEDGKFDIVASGITMRPERSVAGRFTVPVAETSPVVLARPPERFRGLPDLDRPQIRIAVNAGGHLERVARARFPRAHLVAVPDNHAVLPLLQEERVHAVVTDSVEATHWKAAVGVPVRQLGPLSADRKAWWVHPARAELVRELDAWLLAREADGTLARLRQEWLGSEAAATADPLGALLGAIDERLTLMPLVGVVKRRDGVALEVPEREVYVIDRAIADLEAAAEREEKEAPATPALHALFQAQIDAAKRVQWRAVKDAEYVPPALPDLDAALRPALVRIGERVAQLVLQLPADLPLETIRARARSELRAPYLDDELRLALADAIGDCLPKDPEELEAPAPPEILPEDAVLPPTDA